MTCENNEFYYRPQRSCGQGYVFTRVCDSVHGGGFSLPGPEGISGQAPPPDLAGRPPPPPQTWQGEPPPDLAGRKPPQTRQTPPDLAGRTPPKPPPPHPGPGRPSLDLAGRTPLPRIRQTPREEDCSIRSMSGRYASYWNAFLFVFLSDDASTSEYTKELVPEMDF